MTLILLVTSLVLLILAGVGTPSGRVNLGWLGLAFYIASILLSSNG